MESFFDGDIRKLCCTCLSVDRKLTQLSGIVDGVNDLYWLLSHDAEAYKEGFYKDTTKLYICWECKATMSRICKFRRQACIAQKRLSSFEDGRSDIKYYTTLSRLSVSNKNTFDLEYISTREPPQNYIFIDCGIIVDNIKVESDEDIPLSELNQHKLLGNDDLPDMDQNFEHDIKIEDDIDFVDSTIADTEYIPNIKRSKVKKKNVIKTKKDGDKDKNVTKVRKRSEYTRKRKTDAFSEENRKHYTIALITDAELMAYRDQKRLQPEYADAPNKCESCIEGYKSESNFEKHKLLHEQKPKYTQCEVCLQYVRNVSIEEHVRLHYQKYQCKYCALQACDVTAVLRHLRQRHDLLDVVVPKRWKKGERKTPFPKNPGSKPRTEKANMDKRTALGYRCNECDKYFVDKKQRWMHVQKEHREGHRCSTCGKRFSFKSHLQKHEKLHLGPPERTACPQCGKLVRVALLAVHARLHAPRAPHACAHCDKRFISRESYLVHLKYSRAHAKEYTLKFKCDYCAKGYRSKGELADHINYVHMGKTHHKCPLCDKPLASKRCITRHIQRTHYGVRENPRDKVCQQCGKTFRDKKGLREHERIHTGERPLSCEVCGCTFRQSASLYTHKKRVHKIYPQKRTIRVATGAISQFHNEKLVGPIVPNTTKEVIENVPNIIPNS